MHLAINKLSPEHADAIWRLTGCKIRVIAISPLSNRRYTNAKKHLANFDMESNVAPSFDRLMTNAIGELELAKKANI